MVNIVFLDNYNTHRYYSNSDCYFVQQNFMFNRKHLIGYIPSVNTQASDRERNDLQIEMLPGHAHTANPSNIEENPSYISTELLIKVNTCYCKL